MVAVELKRIFTVDTRRSHLPAWGSPNFKRFVISTLGDAIYTHISHVLFGFSLSNFPEWGKEIDAVYINAISYDDASGLLFLACHSQSGNSPMRLLDITESAQNRQRTKWLSVDRSLEFRRRYRHGHGKNLESSGITVVEHSISSANTALLDPPHNCIFVGGRAFTKGQGVDVFCKFSLQGELLREVEGYHPGSLLSHPHPSQLIGIDGPDVLLLDTDTLAPIRRQLLAASRLTSIDANSDRTFIVVTTDEGNIIAIDGDFRNIWTHQLDCFARCVRFDRASQCFFVGTNLGDLLAYDLGGELRLHERVSESVRDIAFLHHGRHVLVGCKNMDFHLFRNEGVPASTMHEWEERLVKIGTSVYTSTGTAPRSRIFISYANSDKEFVERLERRLSDEGFLCWRDEHSLISGRITAQLKRAITENDVVLVILSRNSIESDWVRWELESARDVEKSTGRDVICPVAIDDVWKEWSDDPVLKREVLKYHVLSFLDHENEFDEAFVRLVSGIRQNYILETHGLETE